MNKKKKRTLIIILLVVIVLAVVLALFFRKPKEFEKQIETVKIEKGVIGNAVTATGTIEPISTVEVGTQVSGTIAKLYVDYNSVVKKGQLLAELDCTVLLSELKQQENNMESAKNELEYQEKNYKRIKGLYEKEKVSASEYETAEYKYKSALYAFNRAQAQVVTSKTNLSYATIYSPIDGVVLSKSVQEGQTVAASFSTPTLFTIANDLTKMQVIADVDEADIGQVKVGQKVEFTVDAFPDDRFEGRVTQIRLEAQVTSNVVTYNVVIEAPNPELKLMPGLTASINIFTLNLEDVLLLPVKATNFSPDKSQLKKKTSKDMLQVRTENMENIASPQEVEKAKNEEENSTKVVWMKKGNDKIPVKVTVGETDGVNFEIKNGLKEGEEVIVSESEVSKDKTEAEAAKSPFMPGPPESKKKNK